MFCPLLLAATVGLLSVTAVESVKPDETSAGRLLLFHHLDRVTCSSNVGSPGTCFPLTNCLRLGGRPSGVCAYGLAVCCVINKKCNDTSSAEVVNFVNPSYPKEDKDPSSCILTIQAYKKNICQIRLDFDQFELASEPNVNADTQESSMDCSDTGLTVKPNPGGSLGFTALCGNNTGQHLYIPVDTSLGPTSVQLTVVTTGAALYRWKIRATQVDCTQQPLDVAPPGCLQYYTDERGSFSSFGYGSGNGGYMSNLNYAVCIRRTTGSCGIRYSARDSFKMAAVRPTIPSGDMGCDPDTSDSGITTPSTNPSTTESTTTTSPIPTTTTPTTTTTTISTTTTTTAPTTTTPTTTTTPSPITTTPTPTTTTPTTTTTPSPITTTPTPTTTLTPETTPITTTTPTTNEPAATPPPTTLPPATEQPGGGGRRSRQAQTSSGVSRDFLYIPEAHVEGIQGHVTKFCGDFLDRKTITSVVPGPYVVWFHSDGKRAGKGTGDEVGFKVNFQQLSVC